LKILYAIETLEIGGAEKFVVEIANSITRYSNAYLFIILHDRVNKDLLTQLSSDVAIVSESIPFDYLLQKIDGLLYLLNIPIRCRDTIVKNELGKAIEKHKIDVIHSNQFNVDNICLKVGLLKNVPVVSTIHGDYLNFYNLYNKKVKVYGNINFESRLKFNLRHLSSIVYISDNQLTFFNKLKAQGYAMNQLTKIYNGISHPTFQKTTRQSIGIKENSFVFGMVARGIKEKGWQAAIDAFLALNNNAVVLILVGDSSYLQSLKEEYLSNPQIIFAGFVSNPAEWIQHFDVGILPTVYTSESLPTSIIEYLALSKPVIATDIGEIRLMINANHKKAGIVIPKTESKLLLKELIQSMNVLLTHKEALDNYRLGTAEAFKSFDISTCSNSYFTLYEKIVNYN
jgi:glycosyltransferase involved in cell wall biosynthesis